MSPEKVTAFFTGVLAFIAVLQLYVYRQQKAIMDSSGKQTDQLIAAANIQASAAKKNAESAAQSAAAADRFATTSEKTLKQIIAGSADTHSIALAAQIQAAAVAPLVQWSRMIVCHLEDKRIFAQIEMENHGRTPAQSVAVAMKAEFRKRPPSRAEWRFSANDFKPLDPNEPNPLLPYDSSFTKSTIAYSNKFVKASFPPASNSKLFVWGIIRAKQTSGGVSTFCRYVSIDKVLDSPAGNVNVSPGAGYRGPYENCDPKDAN
jgi:hypothetical protein